MSKLTKFALAVGFQVAVIFAIIIFKVSVLAGGTDILLRITPVDPTSPTRGDYATFQYDISNLDSYLLGGLRVESGDTVYVVLRQSGKYWSAQSVVLNKPSDSGQVFIKGRVADTGVPSGVSAEQQAPGYSFHVVYGAEEYFIPEGSGRDFNFLDKEMAANLAVDDEGNAVLKRIYVDGKVWP